MKAARDQHLVIRGVRVAMGPHEAKLASVQIAGCRISRILSSPSHLPTAVLGATVLDLSGFLILPGLINAHDHLEFSLFPRLGNPPYRNYVEWGEDIHQRFPDLIAKHHAVPKEIRLWWGGVRNLLCGVTRVSHHNPLWPELVREDFPVRVVTKYGWGHSLALDGDLRRAHAGIRDGRPFIVHACEGVDELAREELQGLDQLGLLDDSAVLVHGLAIDDPGVSLIRSRRASLITCPSSNNFLFAQLPDICLLSRIEKLALGSDSPLTAEGDLLDEVRYAIRFCSLSPTAAYHMVTTIPAAIFQLESAAGSIVESGMADLIAVQDTGHNPAERLQTLTASDVELVIIEGRIQLSSESVLEHLPSSMRQGLEPLSVDGSIRWLRAPVETLLHRAEQALGRGQVRLGNKHVRMPAGVEAQHDC